MTKRNPGVRYHPARPLDSAQQVLDGLDKLLAEAAEHGIQPTKAVAATREALADVILEEAQTDSEIADVARHLDGAADDALDALAREDATPQQRSEAAARVISGATPQTARQLTKMRNQNKFRRAREAHNHLHRLGDALVVDLLRPWALAIVTELTEEPHTIADHVVAGKWQGIMAAEEFRQEHSIMADDIRRWTSMPSRHSLEYRRLRAIQLVAEFEHLTNVTDELRRRGILPDLDPEQTTATSASLYFQDPTKLADAASVGARTVLWLCQGIIAGSGPTIRTAAEAVSAHKEAPAMAN
ncbi:MULTISPECIES: hypothetical protein [unclassified Gordonia (in: high G+C Gram-positive bacteria)]|uniref:hypothetical protein n=1 Tax=unclassified Gordonia (in: high G+C Gram-positive bacteria) TaxID=2657482 RepID=UPI00083AF775|nr:MULTISPECIES: hypothetical protein [unclassified Gordonia (in: high G+C Gram-positive bacteria)]MBN0975504.1 hypothetical protein [Gordonia sp. BP-119]MBN0984025.1 hypothetical protein [Gordonia sp. BP-94]OCW85624.1 hypothetical protein A8M60_04805 [Nocardia farcinica]WGJ84202.1 hypothetical protein QAD21_15555 [Gordonia sp. SMJS1]